MSIGSNTGAKRQQRRPSSITAVEAAGTGPSYPSAPTITLNGEWQHVSLEGDTRPCFFRSVDGVVFCAPADPHGLPRTQGQFCLWPGSRSSDTQAADVQTVTEAAHRVGTGTPPMSKKSARRSLISNAIRFVQKKMRQIRDR